MSWYELAHSILSFNWTWDGLSNILLDFVAIVPFIGNFARGFKARVRAFKPMYAFADGIDNFNDSRNAINLVDASQLGKKLNKVEDGIDVARNAKKADEVGSVLPNNINVGKVVENGDGWNEIINDISSKYPEQLIAEGWQDIAHPQAKAKGSIELFNPKSGLKVRFDKKVECVNGFKAIVHYHIYNPNSTKGKKDLYLDINRNPVRKHSNASHIIVKGGK